MLLVIHGIGEMDSKMLSAINSNQHCATFSIFGSQQLEIKAGPLRTPTCIHSSCLHSKIKKLFLLG